MTGSIVILEAVSAVVDVVAVVALPLKLPVSEVAVTLPVTAKVEPLNGLHLQLQLKRVYLTTS